MAGLASDSGRLVKSDDISLLYRWGNFASPQCEWRDWPPGGTVPYRVGGTEKQPASHDSQAAWSAQFRTPGKSVLPCQDRETGPACLPEPRETE